MIEFDLFLSDASGTYGLAKGDEEHRYHWKNFSKVGSLAILAVAVHYFYIRECWAILEALPMHLCNSVRQAAHGPVSCATHHRLDFL